MVINSRKEDVSAVCERLLAALARIALIVPTDRNICSTQCKFLQFLLVVLPAQRSNHELPSSDHELPCSTSNKPACHSRLILLQLLEMQIDMVIRSFHCNARLLVPRSPRDRDLGHRKRIPPKKKQENLIQRSKPPSSPPRPPPPPEWEDDVHWFFRITRRLQNLDVLLGSIIGLCTITYLYDLLLWSKSVSENTPQSVLRYKAFRDRWALREDDVQNGKYYKIITSGFMHGGLIHLGINMYVLWTFGRGVAHIIGGRLFVASYLGSILFGGLSQDIYWRNTPPEREPRGAVGASAGLFGTVAIRCCMLPMEGVLLFGFLPMSSRTAIIGTAVGSVACMANGLLPNIGHAAHLGGMAFGTLFYFAVIRKSPRFLRWQIQQRAIIEQIKRVLEKNKK